MIDNQEKGVEMRNINFSINGHAILKDVNFYINKREISALIGENGAGKSSLMRILSGVYKKYEGDILIDGHNVQINSVIEAQKLGIRMIQAEPQLVKELNVKGNIFMGNEQNFRNIPLINKRYELDAARDMLRFLQSEIDINSLVSELSLGEKKIVEIAKALVCNAKVIILDEVTASFLTEDRNKLFEVIRSLKDQGLGIVFISHKMDEVLELADRIVVMRDGRIYDDKKINETFSYTDIDGLMAKMTGIDYLNRYPKTKSKKGDVLLEVKKIGNAQQTVKNASVSIRKGEIVGIAGLIGAGKTSLARLVAGVDPCTEGEYYLHRKRIRNKKTNWFVKNGVIFLSKNIEDNIIMTKDVKYNISLPSLNEKNTFFYILNLKKIMDVAKGFIKILNLKMVSPNSMAFTLSRGTQQKIALSKWIEADVELLVMDEPTMHLDIASKVDVYNIMNKLTHRGKSILMTSSDLTELLGMCDRIYIMFGEKITAELNSEEANSLLILQYASGKK